MYRTGKYKTNTCNYSRNKTLYQKKQTPYVMKKDRLDNNLNQQCHTYKQRTGRGTLYYLQYEQKTVIMKVVEVTGYVT